MTRKEQDSFNETMFPGFFLEEEERLWVSGRSSREEILSSEGLTIEAPLSLRNFLGGGNDR